MFDFRKLLKLLEKELGYQEKLLELLSKERAAIVKLNQDQLDDLRVRKEEILQDVLDIEQRRGQIFAQLAANENREEPLKFSEVIERCPPSEGKGPLRHVGDNLRRVASQVQEMNQYNGELIKHSLGLIASTVAIMRSAPEADLPTYTQAGSLNKPHEDPAFVARPTLSKEA